MQFLPLLFAMLAAGADAPTSLRVATFNVWELSAAKIDAVGADGRGTNPQLRGAAEVIQRVRPDVLLLNEIDFDEQRNLAALFVERYLAVGQNGQEPIVYSHIHQQPVNTGLPSGMDLDNDGRSDGPGDAHGYGRYPGQYGIALLSRFPLDSAAARSFQKLRWKDMPGHLIPDGRDGRPAWYDAAEVEVLRLSSKSHWDVPLRVGEFTLHLLCSHPTPPVFDGDEDRNGRRNHDEIRFWADYLSGGASAAYIVDDQGRRGPLAPDATFVILGDLNADPTRDPAPYGPSAISRLLDHPRVVDPAATSAGAPGKNPPGAPYFLERKTCDFGRIDYTLCARELKILAAGVFWPPEGDPLNALVASRENSSDHRLVWADIAVPRRDAN